jgi:predicted RNA polymerase sigma factor
MTVDDQLFRRESGRMLAALTRVLGARNLALAEDMVQEAFCRAIEVWSTRGPPPNPQAWLMATAKNRALDAPPADRGGLRAGARRHCEVRVDPRAGGGGHVLAWRDPR